VNTLSKQVTVGGTLVQLSVKEFQLLATLAADPNRVFSQEGAAGDGVGSQVARQDADGRVDRNGETPQKRSVGPSLLVLWLC
jgi:hypothetical protein